MWCCDICRFSIVVFNVFIWGSVPILLFWWCIHQICIARGSYLGVLDSGFIVGSSYVIVSATKCIITCVSGNGLSSGVRFWYQLLSGIVRIVMVYGSCFAANLAQ